MPRDYQPSRLSDGFRYEDEGVAIVDHEPLTEDEQHARGESSGEEGAGGESSGDAREASGDSSREGGTTTSGEASRSSSRSSSSSSSLARSARAGSVVAPSPMVAPLAIAEGVPAATFPSLDCPTVYWKGFKFTST